MRRSLVVGTMVSALVAAAVSGPSVRARADVIERVVAVVNDEAIFLSDLRRRSVPFLPQVMAAESEPARLERLEQLYAQLLDQLIDEQLIRQQAVEMQVRVSADDVEHAIENVQRQSGLSAEQFWAAVREQGMTESQYRTDVRRQLLRLKVLNQRVRGRVNITEEDVRQRYEQRLREANRELRFRAGHCFLQIESGATATQVAAVRDNADRAAQGLTADAFDACVSQHGGGQLGWLSQGDLPPTLEQALLALRPGQVSKPVRGPAGYHIFVLHERERGSANMPSYEQVRDQIFREMLDRAMARQEKQFLEELRREAVIARHMRLGSS